MQIGIIPELMAEKPHRDRPNKLVTLDPSTIKAAMAVAKKQKPPITALSRLIDVALAEWTANHKAEIKR